MPTLPNNLKLRLPCRYKRVQGPLVWLQGWLQQLQATKRLLCIVHDLTIDARWASVNGDHWAKFRRKKRKACASVLLPQTAHSCCWQYMYEWAEVPTDGIIQKPVLKYVDGLCRAGSTTDLASKCGAVKPGFKLLCLCLNSCEAKTLNLPVLSELQQLQHLST